jgi:hypothetical protein
MNTYLIDFKNDASDEKIQEYINDNQLSQIKLFNRLDKTYQVNSESQPPTTEIVNTIVNDDTSHLELLTTIDVPMPPSPTIKSFDSGDENNWWKLYSMMEADLDNPTMDAKIFGQGINIYVVDSGIDINHTEFANQDINLIYSFTGEFTDNNGHGTGLSSLIVGNTCGLTNATLNVVKIFDKNIPTKQSDLLSALNAILEDALVSSNRASIVNLSWSIPKNSFIESKIQCLIDAGIFVVAAAGNSGMPISDVTPASMPGVFTIGSYGQDFIPSDFSSYTNSAISCTPNVTNFGSLDSWAPGENIYLAIPGNNSYSLASGTSLSCAIYSGSLAYNFSQELTSTGELPLMLRTTLRRPIVTDRKGLLDLSDPRYSSSVNKICTYTTTFLNINTTDLINLPVQAITYPGKFIVRRFIYPQLVKSYEILGELPNEIAVDGIYLNIKFQNEPVSEKHVDQYSIPVRLDLRDNTSITKTIEITLIGSAFDADILPQDDPILEILLLAGTCPGTGNVCNNQSCGGCPSPSVPLLMGDMTTKPAGDIQVGDFLYTMHEITKEFGKFMVTAKTIHEQPMVNIFFTDDTTLSVSRTHKFLMSSGDWQQVFELGEGAVIKGIEIDKTIKSIVDLGLAPAVKLTVKDAHTYVAGGLISHNAKQGGATFTGTCSRVTSKTCICA